MNKKSLSKLEHIYSNPALSAELIGLTHIDPDTIKGFTRKKKGKHFQYLDRDNKIIDDEKIIKRLDALAIPPAWTEVWIAPKSSHHIQAVGRDEAERRQYIYHDIWKESRNIINFYRLILFGNILPALRKHIQTQLRKEKLTKQYTTSLALAIIDETAIRVGHETYFEEHDSVGLTTLRKEHVSFHTKHVLLHFIGKSGVEQHIEIKKPHLRTHLQTLHKVPGEHMFQYKKADGEYSPLIADDINEFLTAHTDYHISAKDFRTWHGTLACFKQGITIMDEKKTKKIMSSIIEDASELLGNTPTVARKHYIHSDLLSTIQDDRFSEYYKKCESCKAKSGLTKAETQLLLYLEILFNEDFDLFSQTTK